MRPNHEHAHTKTTSSGAAGKVALAGVIGAAVGAGAAMLLSPWRGAEARLRLRDRMRGACFSARDVTSKAKEVASKARDVLPHKKSED